VIVTSYRGFKPALHYVLVQRNAAETETPGGIVLPDSAQNAAFGVIVGSHSDLWPAGAEILMPNYVDAHLKLGDDEFVLIHEDNIMGAKVSDD
jgi:co-chaperonin GroES (HSP10)